MTNENTKGKHTPGPWEIDEAGGGWWIYGGNDPRPAIGVAKCDAIVSAIGNICKQQNIIGQGLSNQELSANARLIAAAPDMLRSLRAITDFITRGGSVDSMRETYSSISMRQNSMIQNALSAIAKAEGAQ